MKRCEETQDSTGQGQFPSPTTTQEQKEQKPGGDQGLCLNCARRDEGDGRGCDGLMATGNWWQKGVPTSLKERKQREGTQKTTATKPERTRGSEAEQ